MTQNNCKTCKHFHQHYTFNEQRIFKVYCGHCSHSKIKKKTPDSKSCENYIQTEPIEESFVTKEYLSKSLLEYFFKLELLPQIYNAEISPED